MRLCRDCSAELVRGENWSEGQARSQNYLCRSCNSARGKAHYKMHADRAAQLQRERLKNPSKHARISEQKKTYYAANKHRWVEYRSIQKAKERSDPWYRAGRILTWARARAARMGIEFDLTREWLEHKLANGVCEASGLPLDLAAAGESRIHPWGPSIDRIDCRQGYTQANCQVVVWIYNLAKSDFRHEDVMRLASALIEAPSLE